MTKITRTSWKHYAMSPNHHRFGDTRGRSIKASLKQAKKEGREIRDKLQSGEITIDR